MKRFSLIRSNLSTLGSRKIAVSGLYLACAALFLLFSGTVLSAPLSVNPTILPAPLSGVAYNVTITPSAGTAPYHIALAAGLLPPGLTLTAGPTDATLSGTPGTFSTYDFTLAVGDSVGAETYLTTRMLPLFAGNGTSHSLAAPGSIGPYTVSILGGALPPSMSIGSDGILTGSSSTPGTYNLTVQITDSFGNVGTTMLSIAIAPAIANNITVIPTLSTWALLLLSLGIITLATQLRSR